jgi:hypothetical protein
LDFGDQFGDHGSRARLFIVGLQRRRELHQSELPKQCAADTRDVHSGTATPGPRVMNRPLTLLNVLKGNIPPVKQMRWQYDCLCCGRDNGMENGFPVPVTCVECGSRIEATDNPFFVEAE